VRVTGDCPLIDPGVTDRVITELVEHAAECDYASNVLRRTYPRGLDVEVLFWDVLVRVDRLAASQTAREHATVYVYSERPDLFLCRSVTDVLNNSDLRWTVDTPEDLQLVRALYEGLDLDRNILPYRDIVAFVRAHPEYPSMNAGIRTWQPPRQII
jgi:spore coat polysaccharide biosynthesis protein SpsF